MPPFYMGSPQGFGAQFGDAGRTGGWGSNPIQGGTPGWGGMPTPTTPRPPIRPGEKPPVAAPQAAPPGSVLGAQAIRATGPTQGFDASYLQNLATSIGGLFSRPQGNLSFNPLGDLSDIKSMPTGFGNAPEAGLPSTMMQDALTGGGFSFKPPAPIPTKKPPRDPGEGGRGGRKYESN